MPYSELYYHIVWATKERLPLITKDFQESLYKVIVSKVTELGATVYAIGGIEDHLHLAVRLSPAQAVASFIGALKGSSSHWVNSQIGLDFKWQDDYGVLTFSKKNLKAVIEYIQQQTEHHQNQTCYADWEATTEQIPMNNSLGST